jgi:hypothetical protein
MFMFVAAISLPPYYRVVHLAHGVNILFCEFSIQVSSGHGVISHAVGFGGKHRLFCSGRNGFGGKADWRGKKPGWFYAGQNGFCKKPRWFGSE